MEIDAIDPGERAGRDMGGLGELMASITADGLVNDITVTPARRLILGARRLEACRRLGWSRISVTTVTMVPEALDRIRRDAEGALCMHPLTIPEAIYMDFAVRELKWWPRDGSAVTAGTHRRDERREMMARLYGLNGHQYTIARELVLAAGGYRVVQGTRYPIPAGARERAAAALDAVRGPGDLGVAHREYRGVETPRPAASPRTVRRLPSRDQEAAVSAALAALGGITTGLSGAMIADLEIAADVLQRWNKDLGKAIRVLTKLKREVQQHDDYGDYND